MPRRLWLVAGALALALAAAYFLVDKTWLYGRDASAARTAGTVTDKSIAVLPFTDMSEKKDQAYFADGMAEEIIDLLVKVPGLKVISRASSFQFKGKTEDLRSIGTQLGVAYVLEGSVRKSGDRLRITAQLINSRDGANLFSQTYDRDLSDVLKMQDEIAIALVRALQIEVSPEGLISRPALQNTEAYTLYLEGSHAFDRVDQQGFEQAASYFQQALDSTRPSQPRKYARRLVFRSWTVRIHASSRRFREGSYAAQHALELDPNLAGAHAQLAEVYRASDQDWQAADREIRLARSLAPRDPDVLLYRPCRQKTWVAGTMRWGL